MKQPTKDALREQLALAAEEIIRLRGLTDGVTFATWQIESPIKSARGPWLRLREWTRGWRA